MNNANTITIQIQIFCTTFYVSLYVPLIRIYHVFILLSDGTDEPFFLDEKSNISVHISMSLTNGRKPFNAIDNASDGYETSCIDRWRPINAYITEYGSVTKRSIKATIKATTARYCATIYKYSIKPIQGTENPNTCHSFILWYFLGISRRWLYHRRLFGRHHTGDHLRRSLCSIFRYRDEVVGSSRRAHLAEDSCIISLAPSVGTIFLGLGSRT